MAYLKKIPTKGLCMPLAKSAAIVISATLVSTLLYAQLGINELLLHPEKSLANKRFGIICNKNSIDSHKNFLPDVLCTWAQQSQKAQLTAIFSPEHGLLMDHEAAASVNHNATSQWGCPIYSLHGDTKKPKPDMLKTIDTLIFDLPDIGVRCYTYISTLKLALKAAKENNKEIIILDRPNPLAFWGQRGPMLEKEYESFVGAIYVPFLHGMTIGEIAQYCNKNIGARLIILGSCEQLKFDQNTFKAPSPNIMSMEHLYAYPMTVFLEGTNYSEGRGTMLPFIQVGAPWVNADLLAAKLNAYNWEGITFEPVTFIPLSLPGIADHPKYEHELCNGVRLRIIKPEKFDPMIIAFELLKTLFTLYPAQSAWILWEDKRYNIDIKVGNNTWRTRIENLIKKGGNDSPLAIDL